jgi:hypothetical protein
VGDQRTYKAHADAYLAHPASLTLALGPRLDQGLTTDEIHPVERRLVCGHHRSTTLQTNTGNLRMTPSLACGEQKPGPLGTEQRQNCEDPSIEVWGGLQTQLAEELRTGRFDSSFAERQLVGDAGVGTALSHQRKNLVFACR